VNVRGSKEWRLCVPEMREDDAAEMKRMMPKLRRSLHGDAAAVDGLVFTEADFARLADARQDKSLGCARYDEATFHRMQRCQTVKMEANDILYVSPLTRPKRNSPPFI
jgi:hypothetical protein